MSKLIIRNHTNKTMNDVLVMAQRVIGCGRISDNGKSYCHITTFLNGVACRAVKNKESDTLTFWEEAER